MGVWQDKEETDILECMIEAWHNAECQSIVNFHKYDRPHEEGVDLSCIDSGKTVNLQAKIKPRQKDVDQLIKFSKSKADRRIYVYVVQPSKSFMRAMEKLIDKVDFWDSAKLNSYLLSYRSQFYLGLLFWDSDLLKDIYNIVLKIFSSAKVKPLPLDFSTLEEWWDLKDRTVKLHANLEHLEYFWKDKLLSQDIHDEVILSDLLKGILKSCSIISKTCSKDIFELVSRINDKQPNLLSNYVKEVLPSSPWIGMYSLKDKIDQPEECKKIIHSWVTPMSNGKYGSEYSMISDFLTDLRHCSEAIEDGVDFMFQEFLSHKT